KIKEKLIINLKKLLIKKEKSKIHLRKSLSKINF
ncbi:unnamed protein product, partial [marine sediment metagenome]